MAPFDFKSTLALCDHPVSSLLLTYRYTEEDDVGEDGWHEGGEGEGGVEQVGPVEENEAEIGCRADQQRQVRTLTNTVHLQLTNFTSRQQRLRVSGQTRCSHM